MGYVLVFGLPVACEHSAVHSMISSGDLREPRHVLIPAHQRDCRNTLEALVWEKEAEVDRFRDRWPMSLLVSRARLFSQEEKNRPRDVVAALNDKIGEGGLAILAEVNRA